MKTGLRILAIVLIIISIVFFIEGYTKISDYHNSEYYSKNAYVGGDAYNYIINGTYFTGFSVIGMASFVSGIICLTGSAIIGAIQEKAQKEEKKMEPAIKYDNLPEL